MNIAQKPKPLIIIILALLSMLTPLAIDMYLPAFMDIAQDLRVSQEKVQITLALFTLGFSVGQLFWGPLADSFGRKPFILIGLFVSSICAFFITQISDITLFYVLRFSQGFFGAASVVVLGALLRDMFAKDSFAKMMSIIMIITMVAPLVAPLIGGYITKFYHWHYIFFLLFLVGFLSFILVILKLPETLKKENKVPLKLHSIIKNFGTLLSKREVLGYALCNGFSFAGMFCFLTSGSIVYNKFFEIQKDDFGYFFIPNIIVMMLISTINNKKIPKIGVEKMLKFSLIIQILAGLWVFFCGYFNFGLISITLGVAFSVGAVSTIAGNSTALVLDKFPKSAGTANSLLGVMRFGIGSLVGLILSNFEITSQKPMLYAMFICFSIASFSYLIIVKKNTLYYK